MGASATAGLAVALGAGAEHAVGAGGVAAGLGLCRWRPGRTVLLALVGLAALAAGPWLAPVAALAMGAAAWLPESPPQESDEFSPVVLAAILTFATTALCLLTVGQFTDIDPVAIALATATVLTGMARAGLTVVARLRETRTQALTDDLTGLANRRHLVDTLHATIESAHEQGDELALLLIDLDGFKELNDTLGHHAGDEVLRQIGPRLQDLLRNDDTLARLGGDEFAVILRPGDEASASTAGLRLRAALEESFAVGGIHVHIDASVGIALYPGHAPDAMGLLQRADVAMYQAKRMRTGHEVYLAGRDRHSRQRLALVGELGAALEAGELVLHYQPQAELRTGRVHGVEALVRWEHPERGLLGPSHFLPLVEQSGLTRALTAFVLDRALDEIGRLRRRGRELSVAVNLGPADLLDLGLPSEVERLLDHHRFAPDALEIEVSEDIVMADVERTVDVLVGLRAIGVRTALDDFGAGRAGLAHLKELHVDVLKIDRSFVMRVARRRARRRDRALADGSRPPARRARHRRGRRQRRDLRAARPVGLRRDPGALPRPPDAGGRARALAASAGPAQPRALQSGVAQLGRKSHSGQVETRRRSEPSGFAVQMSANRESLHSENTIRRPSGDQPGFIETVGPAPLCVTYRIRAVQDARLPQSTGTVATSVT